MAGDKKVLIVDDIDINRLILQEILSDTYETVCAGDGAEALEILQNTADKPHLVLLDVMMPVMDGFEVMKRIKADGNLSKIPVIFITALEEEVKGLEAGAVDYISKPFEPQIVRLRVANQIELSLYRAQLEVMVQEKVDELLTVKGNFLDVMAELIEHRSMESGQHVARTKKLSQILIQQMLDAGIYSEDLSTQDISAMIAAVPLHDIGKIAIPDNILLKPGRLTPEEFDVIKTHATVGGEVIAALREVSDDDYLRYCYEIAHSHHERWDGNGYPEGSAHGFAGTDIPLSARVVSVVDVYDALTSERCYKKAMSHERAMEIIREGAGTQFDPEVVRALEMAQDKFVNWGTK
ncbi:two-component system response regulator [Clostridia bacterium]|nr:two-component system response regulator [Clostridia bacterium]